MSEPSAPATLPANPGDRLPWLQRHLDALHAALHEAELRHADAIGSVDSVWTENARNLVHYVTLRARDLRPVQSALSLYGLSSLGRSEAHVLASVSAARTAARALTGRPRDEPAHGSPLDRDADGVPDGAARLAEAADRCLGARRDARYTRIMVTMPSHAADDPALLPDLVGAGMDLIRVNCAHDAPETWQAIIDRARAEAGRAGRPLRVSMDLGGPKLRTGPLASAPGVLRLKPRRDEYGRVVAAAVAWLSPSGSEAAEAEVTPRGPDEADLSALRELGLSAQAAAATVLPVDPGERLPGDGVDSLRLTDARGSRRRLRILYRGPNGLLVSSVKTTYLVAGTELRAAGEGEPLLRIGVLPPLERALRLHRGDTLELLRTAEALSVDPDGPARIGCTLPEVFDAVLPGQRVLLDDGAIEGRVAGADPERIEVRIERTAPGGSKLRAEKGINLPDTVLPISALTAQDRADLAFVAEHADLVNVSFVNSASDVEEIIELLGASPAADRDFGLVLKIETVRGFRNLPQILLAAMSWPRIGVMIARGDLAVEIGFERMAEVQQEILWLCEAAGVPVIWATQVLEQLAKTGLPTRAEITDAAESQRAEAVMLNKGPFIVTAVRALDDVLGRMQAHAEKKTSLLRRLESWDLDRPG
ncbi:pyruvate kinase [Leucobacter weissii]|uniref:pyruvate kinase n=1 Tax=Leucobacter weissii TaxID=1983706 RepID=A0A939S8V3_9MICO|nr:pyruvate kinase [Leucobacter weissii]MBO1902501.1 pyruvate kinase [Leucobacter weissii]